MTQSLTIAKTVARQYGPYAIDANQELTALAVCNCVVALAKGYPVTGSFSRTAVNASSGGTTPMSSGERRVTLTGYTRVASAPPPQHSLLSTQFWRVQR